MRILLIRWLRSEHLRFRILCRFRILDRNWDYDLATMIARGIRLGEPQNCGCCTACNQAPKGSVRESHAVGFTAVKLFAD